MGILRHRKGHGDNADVESNDTAVDSPTEKGASSFLELCRRTPRCVAVSRMLADPRSRPLLQAPTSRATSTRSSSSSSTTRLSARSAAATTRMRTTRCARSGSGTRRGRRSPCSPTRLRRCVSRPIVRLLARAQADSRPPAGPRGLAPDRPRARSRRRRGGQAPQPVRLQRARVVRLVPRL